MAQYRLGTITATNGSPNIVGVGSFWAANITAGDLFAVASEGAWYEILTVTDDTDLVLNSNYVGTTKAAVAYAIQRDFTPVNNYPTPSFGDIDTSSLIRATLLDIEAALIALSPMSAILQGDITISGSLLLNAAGLTPLPAPTFTVASLPTPTQDGLVAYATNARVFNGAGTQESAGAGTGGLVSSKGSTWRLVGTNTVAIS